MSDAFIHPTTIAEFERTYDKQYEREMKSSDDWIKWCNDQKDAYGVNFHQGKQSALIFNDIQMRQLLRILKQEEPNIA